MSELECRYLMQEREKCLRDCALTYRGVSYLKQICTTKCREKVGPVKS